MVSALAAAAVASGLVESMKTAKPTSNAVLGTSHRLQ
jgi:hypothetical protein